MNFEMPSQVATYVHRIGRTARAGRGGKACTLIGEGRRYLMKEVMKDAEEKARKQKEGTAGVIRSRTIPAAVVSHFVAKINSLEENIKEVLDAEAVARLDRITEMEMMRAQNIIEHSDEIKSRPQKEWFATSKQKISIKEKTAERKRRLEEQTGTGTHRMSRKKRRLNEAREMAHEMMEQEEREAETGKPSKRVISATQQRSSAKAMKRKQDQQMRDSESRSVFDEDLRREMKQKRRKKVGSSDASGDQGLFSEERVAYARRPKKDESAEDGPVKSSYAFREYDPTKRMGKKKAHHGFKSRSKYKRR